MKKILLILSLCSALGMVQAEVAYRTASESDLNEILRLQEGYTDDDKSKLMIYTQDEIRESIQKKRIFLATDNGKIICFVKIFVVDPDEVKETLGLLNLESATLAEDKLYKLGKIDFKKPIS